MSALWRRIDWETILGGAILLAIVVAIGIMATIEDGHLRQDCINRGGDVAHAHNEVGWTCRERP